jgi:hypothetical protein
VVDKIEAEEKGGEKIEEKNEAGGDSVATKELERRGCWKSGNGGRRRWWKGVRERSWVSENEYY